jgi:hypothetical protein
MLRPLSTITQHVQDMVTGSEKYGLASKGRVRIKGGVRGCLLCSCLDLLAMAAQNTGRSCNFSNSFSPPEILQNNNVQKSAQVTP